MMSLTLVCSVLAVIEPARAASMSPEAEPQAVRKVVSRPDVVSAVVSARAQGSRVEVESLRTETSTSWAEASGLMTTEAHAAPIRYKDSAGAWRNVDLTLQKGLDGTVAPRGHKHGLRLGKRSGAAGQVFASATAGTGRQVEWLAPWRLPEPTLDGSKATYAEVQPGIDMVLEARRSGFEHDFIVKSRPASAPVWRIPLRTAGLTAKAEADGSISFVDAQNAVQAAIPVAYMWDAEVDPATGEPANRARVKVSVEQVSAGRATLVIAPDARWFMAAGRVFPVTVDPTYATGTVFPGFDTWVQTNVTTDQSASPELHVGHNGSWTARSFLNFPVSAFKNKQILAAGLSLFESYSQSCTPSTFIVRSANLASTNTRWTSQPVAGSQYGSLSVAKGFSSACPAARVTVTITDLVKAWSTASYTIGGIALMAANEADANSWKRFHSTEGAGDPFITYTWNRAPATPAIPTMDTAVAYAPPGGSSALYTAQRRPWVSTKATDADGNNVRYVFEFHNSTTLSSTSLVASCSSSPGYPSGTTAGCAPSVDLADNASIYVRAKATDGFLESGWSGWRSARVGAQTPAAPGISCPSPYAINSWQDTAPTSNIVCTITAPGTGFSAPGYVRATVDGRPYATNFSGGAAGQIKITPSSDPAVAKTTVTIPKDVSGLHRITVQAESPAGRLSSSSSYSFGWGSASLSSPAVNPRITTTGGVKVEGSGPPRGSAAMPTASLRWRVSGYGAGHETTGWNSIAAADVPLMVTDNGTAGIGITGIWDSTTAKVDAYLDSDPNTAGVQPTTLNDRLPVLLDVQVCLTYASSTQCTWSETKATIQRVPHAFGGGFPVADAGPGQVALWTGEFNIDENDVDVPGYTGGLSLSRSHATYAGATDSVSGVFGPGWTAHFEGADAGLGGVQVVDSTRYDGTIALVDSEGSALVYQSPSGTRRTTATFQTGMWVPADETTDLDTAVLAITGSGASTTITYTEDDGTVTTWTPAAAPTATTDTDFRAISVAEPGIAAKTTYSYNGAGRVTRILAPAPPGVTCPATGTLNPGCRALRFEYGTTGSENGRLVNAWLDIYNPDKAGGAGMDSIKVATYSYDSAGRLHRATDPRSNLFTEYGYNTADLLTSIKPSGQVAYQFEYLTADDREKLSAVTRDRPAGDPTGGTATLARFVYDVPVSGPGLPDLSAGSVARWGQKTVPTKGFAAFGPDHPVTGSPAAGDWQYADIQYTDANGYTVNTASFGAGDWQYTATDYDSSGNVVRQLDERALRLIIDNTLPAGAAVDQLASLHVYNGDVRNSAGDVVTPAGTLLTDSYGPARFATLTDGTQRWVRARTHTAYDVGAPNQGTNPVTGEPYRTPTAETTWAFDPGTGTDIEALERTLTGYTPIAAGDLDGWSLGLPSTVTTDMDLSGTLSAGDLTKVSRFDTEGRLIESRQPGSNGSDAGTTRTIYFTAATNAAAPECGAKPYWAGLLCKTYPAAAPASKPGQPGTPRTPTVTTNRFSYLLVPTEQIETSGPVTRTTTTTLLADGNPSSVTIAAAGLPGSTPTTRKETTYDPATGMPTVVTARNADGTVASTVTTAYDGWGRPISYQPSGQQPTTTTYNSAGAVDTITDANGATRYTYDGTDAAGRTEHRGLVTKIDVTTAGATWTSTGAFDADEALITEKLPGGITRHTDIDHTGEPKALRYTGQVTTLNDDGSTTIAPNGGWLSWSMDSDPDGKLTREWTPDGAAFTGPANGTGDVGDAIPYDRSYRYDASGRLTQVRDRTATTTGVDVTDPVEAPPCVTRSYTFDPNDNRLSAASTPAATDGSCQTTGGNTATRAFDTADRPTSGANGAGTYAYDLLGRGLTVPASDTPHPTAGDATLTYYDNDLPRSITQAGVTTTFSLDALDRRTTETTTEAGASLITTRHYTDTSDNPTWVTNGTSTQRYAELLSGDLTLSVDQTGHGILTVANPGGHIVTTIELATPPDTAVAINGWDGYDEYGKPAGSNNTNTGPVTYGWLGAKQRATAGTGLILMGVRLYNPATGLFTSMDPVAGGTANDYTYPTDPINDSDTTGQMMKPERLSGHRIGSNHRTRGRGEMAPRSSSACCVRVSGGYRYSPRHLDRMQDRLEGKRMNGVRSNRKGQQGMHKAGVGKYKNTKKVTWKGRDRIYDWRKGKTVGEVKYYRPGRTLGATRQIRDMAEYADKHGLKFVLKVNRGVKLSKNLQRLVRQGYVKISRY